MAGREAGGYGLDAQWSDDFHHALHAVLTGETDGYYADFGSLSRPGRRRCARRFVYDGDYSPHRGRRARPARRRAARATASSATSRTTTRSATGPSGERIARIS